VSVRAVRGATQLDRDEAEHMHERVAELVRLILECNRLVDDDLISIWFTTTVDLHSDYPAYAARQMGFTDVPLMCTQEMDVEGGMPRVVRVMAHVETGLSRAEVTHVYLHGAAALRRDLNHVRAVPDDPADG
jgi:chorismate mutase